MGMVFLSDSELKLFQLILKQPEPQTALQILEEIDKSSSQVHRLLNSLTEKELIQHRRELMENGRPPGYYTLNVSEVTITIKKDEVSVNLQYVNEKKPDKIITYPIAE